MMRRPRLTKENLGFLVSTLRSLAKDLDGTQHGRRLQSILMWAQDQLADAPEEKPDPLTNGKEGGT
jgi:hypothetical protein